MFYKFSSIDEEKFAKELNRFHKLVKEKEIKSINISLNNALVKNIHIFGYYIINLIKKTKLGLIKFSFDEDLEDILFNKAIIHFKNYLSYYLEFVKIEFSEIPDEELFFLFGVRNYLNYIYKNGREALLKKDIFEQEIKRAERNKKLFKYSEFKAFLDLVRKFPFSFINYPIQKGYERFVIYIFLYKESQKSELINFLKNYGLDPTKRFTEIIRKIRINLEIYGVAIGLRYKNNIKDRVTLYLKFDRTIVERGLVKEHLKRMIDLDLNFFGINLKNSWYYAIDYNFVSKKFTYKVYDEPYKFNVNLNDSLLNRIFNGKKSTKVYKIRDNRIFNVKFEFSLKEVFNDDEKKILKEYGFFEEDKDVLSLYIDESTGFIKKFVLYNLS